jgi:hypothetical protein
MEENGMHGVKWQKSYDKVVLFEWFLFFCYNRKKKIIEKTVKRRLVRKITGSLSAQSTYI